MFFRVIHRYARFVSAPAVAAGILVTMLYGCAPQRQSSSSSVDFPGSDIGWVSSHDVAVVSLMREGMANSREGKQLEAEGLFLRAYLLESQNPAIAESLAEVSLLNGRPEDARMWSQRAMAGRKDFKANPTLSARIAFFEGRRKDAIGLLRQALDLALKSRRHASFVEIQKSLAGVLRGGGDFAGALCALQEAAGTSPSIGEVTGIGEGLNELGLHCQAIKLLEPQFGPGASSTDPLGLYQLGIAYAGCGRLEDARRVLLFAEAQQSGDLPRVRVSLARRLVEHNLLTNSSGEFSFSDGDSLPREWPYWMVKSVRLG